VCVCVGRREGGLPGVSTVRTIPYQNLTLVFNLEITFIKQKRVL